MFEKEMPIDNLNALSEWFAVGCKPKSEWRIGTEHEKFGFCRVSKTPLQYEGKASIFSLFKGLQEKFNWEPVIENDKVIALSRDGASVSLEPGGQLELSGAPLETLHQTCNELNVHLDEIRQITDPEKIGFLGLGFAPDWTLDDMPMMPKDRYKIMRAYMPKVGGLGHQMMFRSATVQVNLDYESEQDMVLKMRLGLALQPLVTAMFANSPLREGRPNGFLSYRSFVWNDTDPDRTGMLRFVFDEGFGFEAYRDFVLDVPMYFIKRNGHYIDATMGSFRQFLEGDHPSLRSEKALWVDWEDHLSTIFPEVRLKRFIEMRGADSGPWKRLCALPAFWTGLLYDSNAMNAAWDVVKDWTACEREGLRMAASKLGLMACIRGRRLHELCAEILEISKAGLANRAKINAVGDDERIFLNDLFAIVVQRRTPAETLLQKFHDEWGGKTEQIYEDYAF